MDIQELPPVADGLFTVRADGPVLLGGMCAACSKRHFPRRERCPFCTATGVEATDLPRQGRVWSWTTQEYQPKAPYREVVQDAFAGYVLGYIDLAGACLVETRLDVPVSDAERRCAIGSEVALVLIPFEHEDGRHLSTFAFRPREVGSSS
ncbi:MAG: uncharacterized protein QOC92_4575 [Acidimicrobiaceae bacterium]|jgi:uncharacterized OB-fold protein